ncbi:hypothetical protein B0H10DRAFT_2240405 [Mycena sp. CBHHK59/15]|nr:hypothetical protein B0H10DRAFT_2240405 [Mycena sp. CBHHK59/15]
MCAADLMLRPLLTGLPPTNTAFNASNVLDWNKLDRFDDYLTHKTGNPTKDAQLTHKTIDIIELSDDDQPTPSTGTFHAETITEEKPVLRDIINLGEAGAFGYLASEAGGANPEGQIVVTRTEKVECVVDLTEVPERFPVPEVDTAFILDFSRDRRAKQETKGGKPKGLGAFLKAERTDAEDMSLTREIFSRELIQNQTDSGSAAGRTASFFRVVQRYKTRGCPKSGCAGVPVLKSIESNDGKVTFIGCEKWVKGEKWAHTYAAIPADVDETILGTYLDGSALPPADLETHGDAEGLCARLIHPRHGKQKECPHVHLREGKVVTGMMVPHACPVTKIVYTSKDPAVQKCVVMFRGRHSHPPWPMEKPGHAAKEDVKKCVAVAGILGETGGHLNSSHTTQAILGTSLDIKHPAFRDTRRLRDEVSRIKAGATPSGLLWAGILDEYANDLKLPLAQRYIHQIRMDGEIIAVAMVADLAALLHDAGVRFLEGDITFKRTNGEMNEWEAAIWYTLTKELEGHHRSTVKQVTGKSVGFKVFDPKGNLYSIHFDMEAAQDQGLGAWLSKMVLDDPVLRALFPSIDPDKLVQFILKLCSVHLERSTDELVPLVGQKTVDYLNRIRGLSDAADIEN